MTYNIVNRLNQNEFGKNLSPLYMLGREEVKVDSWLLVGFNSPPTLVHLKQCLSILVIHWNLLRSS